MRERRTRPTLMRNAKAYKRVTLAMQGTFDSTDDKVPPLPEHSAMVGEPKQTQLLAIGFLLTFLEK